MKPITGGGYAAELNPAQPRGAKSPRIERRSAHQVDLIPPRFHHSEDAEHARASVDAMFHLSIMGDPRGPRAQGAPSDEWRNHVCGLFEEASARTEYSGLTSQGGVNFRAAFQLLDTMATKLKLSGQACRFLIEKSNFLDECLNSNAIAGVKFANGHLRGDGALLSQLIGEVAKAGEMNPELLIAAAALAMQTAPAVRKSLARDVDFSHAMAHASPGTQEAITAKCTQALNKKLTAGSASFSEINKFIALCPAFSREKLDALWQAKLSERTAQDIPAARRPENEPASPRLEKKIDEEEKEKKTKKTNRNPFTGITTALKKIHFPKKEAKATEEALLSTMTRRLSGTEKDADLVPETPGDAVIPSTNPAASKPGDSPAIENGLKSISSRSPREIQNSLAQLLAELRAGKLEISAVVERLTRGEDLSEWKLLGALLYSMQADTDPSEFFAAMAILPRDSQMNDALSSGFALGWRATGGEAGVLAAGASKFGENLRAMPRHGGPDWFGQTMAIYIHMLQVLGQYPIPGIQDYPEQSNLLHAAMYSIDR